MKKIYFFTTALFFSCILLQAQTVINPVSATTTFTAAFGTDLANAYNGTGLESFPSLTANHIATSPADSYVANEITGTIDFDLGATYLIDGLSFWTQNLGGPDTNVGINAVNFYSSLDGTTYTLMAGAPTSFIESTTELSPPETFIFTEVSAAFIRMEVVSNHGGAQTGFAEIAFAEGATLSNVESLELKSVSLYPNPAEDYISISGVSNSENYIIYNILGKEVLKGSISKNEKINIQDIKSGIYLLRINNTNSIKFIKR